MIIEFTIENISIASSVVFTSPSF